MTLQEIQNLSGVLTKDQLPAGYAPTEISPGKYQFSPSELNAIRSQSGYNTTPVTSANLAPSSTPAYGTPATMTSVSPMVNEYVPQTLTPAETTQSDLIRRITAMDTGPTQAEYQAQQEQALKIPELEKTYQDYTSQLKELQNEANQVKLSLKEGAVGRGITTQLLGRQEESLLQTNTIKALQTSSLLESAKGNLSLAREQVDRAVAAKFNQKAADRATAIQNLELLSKDPALTLAEKNRVAAQTYQQKLLDMQENMQAENFRAGTEMAVAAVSKNPTNQAAKMAADQVLKLDPASKNYLASVFSLVGSYQSDPAQIQKDIDAHLKAQADIAVSQANAALANAKTPHEIELAKANVAKAKASLVPLLPNTGPDGAPDKLLSLTDAEKLGVPYGTTQSQAIALGKVPGQASKEGVLATVQDSLNLIDSISKDSGLNSSVGPTLGHVPLPFGLGFDVAPGRIAIADVTGAKQNFLASVQQLTSKQTLDKLIEVKKAGGTFGALSEKELKILEGSSNKISSWAVKDDAGNVVGYNIDEASFKKELDRIKDSTERLKTQIAGVSDTSGSTGEILIERNGVRGTIPPGEFDPKTDKKI